MWFKTCTFLLVTIFFTGFSAQNEDFPTEDEANREEHGNFDFFGRDLIREASKKIKEFQSKYTKGLDSNKTMSSGGLDNFKLKFQAIYPGTKWCGDGNLSNSGDDLGTFSETDKCCKQHDSCPDSIESDGTKHGLINTGLFTRSHCTCDKEFYDCLKNVETLVASSIGYTYFTGLGPQCFKEDYPITGCLEEKMGKCVKYETDQEGERIYQWFDNPPF